MSLFNFYMNTGLNNVFSPNDRLFGSDADHGLLLHCYMRFHYRQVSDIRRTKSQHLKDSHTVLRLSLLKSLEDIYEVDNEDVVGAAPTGDAPTTSEWSTILLSAKVRLILEVLRYILLCRRLWCSLMNVHNLFLNWLFNYHNKTILYWLM